MILNINKTVNENRDISSNTIENYDDYIKKRESVRFLTRQIPIMNNKNDDYNENNIILSNQNMSDNNIEINIDNEKININITSRKRNLGIKKNNG